VNESLVDLLRHPGRVELWRLPEVLRKKVRRTIRAWRLPEALKKVGRSNAHAAEQYRLRPYAGKATLLRAGDSWRVSDDPYAKWEQLAGTLETVRIPGTHMEILRQPHVALLAESLKGCMERASAGIGAGLGEPEVLVRNAG
jgi:thioesterase domain-containing protein